MTYGFVYVLENPALPGLLKVGATEKSPQARALELSRASGVLQPFEVLCYSESEKPWLIEAKIHAGLDAFRPNANREFFACNRRLLVAAVYWDPWKLAFCEPACLWRPLHVEFGIPCLMHLRNPWLGENLQPNDVRELAHG